MQSIGSIFGVAALVTTGACAHVQPQEGEPQSEVAATAPQVATDTGSVHQAVDAPSEQAAPALAFGDPAPSPFEPASAEPAPQVAPDSAAPKPVAHADEAPRGDAPRGEVAKQPVEVAYTVGDVAIGRFVLTHGVENREPVDEVKSFAPGERVYAYVQAVNPDGEQYDLHIRWTKGEEQLGQPVAVAIGTGQRWRSWAWRHAPASPGEYRCVIETADGQLIAEVPFEVKG